MKITMRQLEEMASFSSQTELKSLFNIYGVFTVINDNSIIIEEITSHEKWIDFLILKKLINKTMKHLLFFLILGISLTASAQDYSSEKTTLANFLKRMYNQTKFEGVKIVEDYDNQYFISVLSLEKARYKTQSTMFRVANVKALRQASEYVNGGKITSDLVIRTTEVKDSSGTIKVSEETVEKIHSMGFVQGMELLINFMPADTAKTVFIYSRKIE